MVAGCTILMREKSDFLFEMKIFNSANWTRYDREAEKKKNIFVLIEKSAQSRHGSRKTIGRTAFSRNKKSMATGGQKSFLEVFIVIQKSSSSAKLTVKWVFRCQ